MASTTLLLLLLICGCASATHYRLPKEVTPIRYELCISLNKDFVQTRQFQGNLKLPITIKEPTPQITLNSLRLNYSLAKVYRGDKVDEEQNVPTERPLYKPLYERISLNPKKSPVFDEGKALLFFEFTGKFSDDSKGFYLNSYTQHGTKVWFAATHMEPIYARRVFPCFDEPDFKTPFNIVLTYPRTYRAISNQDEVTRETDGNFYVSTFNSTPKLPTCAVAFVVCQLSKTTQLNGIVHSVWSQAELQKHVQFAMNVTPTIINKLNEVTGVRLNELTKLDQVVVPEFIPDGMQNWGLMVYSESHFILDDPEQSTHHKQFVLRMQIHLLAHTWFGNLRTCKWWNVYWLNEGIAAFMQYYILEQLEDWHIMDQFVVESLQPIINLDSLSSTTELSAPEEEVMTPSDIEGRINSISFIKGSSIIRMMMFFMGETLFLKGLQRYLSDKYIPHFSSVVPNDFWNAWNIPELKKILPRERNLSEVMNSWTEVKGLPIVYVTRADKKVQLKAERFISKLLNSDNTGEKLRSKYYIPITYVTHTSGEFTDIVINSNTWIDRDHILEIEEDLRDENAWIVVNLQSLAYIRVRYDDELWKKLEKVLKTDLTVIHPLNRAQIVDDAFNLARVGKMNYNQTFDLLKYLEGEINYLPWISAFRGFDFLMRRFDTEPNIAKILKIFVKRLIMKVYEATEKMEDSKKHTDRLKYSKVMYWACHLGYRRCLYNADNQFDRLYRKNEMIKPDLREHVYCIGIHESVNNREWEFLYQRMMTTPIESERETIISALGCSPHVHLLTLYLERSISPKFGIRKHDAANIFMAVISNTPEGVQVALVFLTKNYEALRKYHSSEAFTLIITTLAEKLRTRAQLQRFKAFLETTDLKKDTIQVALDTCNENLAWVEAKKGELIVYLRDNINTEKKGDSMATAPDYFTLFATLVVYYYQ